MPYTKYHEAWAGTDDLTGAAWNHIETQWDFIKAEADAHNHDTRYYTKTLADATFFTTTFYTGFDADKIDGSHFSDLVAAAMPIGAIMIWSGTDANVPTNWHICDGGTYGGYATPDLRDRFVVGAGSTYAVNATGGPATWNGTITPTGTVTVGNHALTTSEIPSHTHGYTEYYNLFGCYKNEYATGHWTGPTSRAASINNQNVGGGGAHGHTGSTASFNAIDPRGPWYSLYHIMKYA